MMTLNYVCTRFLLHLYKIVVFKVRRKQGTDWLERGTMEFVGRFSTCESLLYNEQKALLGGQYRLILDWVLASAYGILHNPATC